LGNIEDFGKILKILEGLCKK